MLENIDVIGEIGRTVGRILLPGLLTCFAFGHIFKTLSISKGNEIKFVFYSYLLSDTTYRASRLLGSEYF